MKTDGGLMILQDVASRLSPRYQLGPQEQSRTVPSSVTT